MASIKTAILLLLTFRDFHYFRSMQNNGKVKLVATDLDGTFLRDDKSISSENLQLLHSLGEKGIIRVAATGRNLHKTREVIPTEIPFDYIVFSSGAGVWDWQQHELLFSRNIPCEVAQSLSQFLADNDYSFHLFLPVPENHQCWYHRNSQPDAEFERYFDFLNAKSEEWNPDKIFASEAAQFLVILPEDPAFFELLKRRITSRFPELKIVRTSSPFLTGSIWMEIFHQDVSKGNGVRFLCEQKNIQQEYTLGIGNDYNDIDLLQFTGYSYMVANGPDDLKTHFTTVGSNEEHAFATSVSAHL